MVPVRAALLVQELVPYLPDNTKAIVQQEWGYIQASGRAFGKGRGQSLSGLLVVPPNIANECAIMFASALTCATGVCQCGPAAGNPGYQ